MPSRSFNGSSSLSASVAAVSASPFWYSCWFNPTVVSGARALFGIFSGGATSNGWYLSMESGSANRLSFVADQGNTFAIATTTNTCVAGQWCHAYGQENSATDRTVVLNGDWTNRGTNATSKTPGSLAQTAVGAFIQNGGTPTSQWNGLVAQVAVGRGQLTPSEVLALSKGASPWDIRPNNILMWLPMGLGSLVEFDPTNRFRTPLTNTGTTISSREPSLLLPMQSKRFKLVNKLASPVNASLAKTESADTLSAAAQVKLQASETTTEFADTLSSAGKIKLQASVGPTETADTLSATGSLKLQGALTGTETADSLASAGTIKLQATASVTETADTLASAAALKLQAASSETESADTLTSDATVKVQATEAGLEQADTLAASAAVRLQATAAIPEAADTLAASGGLIIQGAVSSIEAADSLSSTAGGQSSVSSDLNATEIGDTLVSSARHQEAQPSGGRAFSRPYFYHLPEMKRLVTAEVNVKERGDSCAATATIGFDLVAIDNDWLLLAA